MRLIFRAVSGCAGATAADGCGDVLRLVPAVRFTEQLNVAAGALANAEFDGAAADGRGRARGEVEEGPSAENDDGY